MKRLFQYIDWEKKIKIQSRAVRKGTEEGKVKLSGIGD